MSQKILLELSDGASNKFWEGSVSGKTLTVRFGRIGTDGQTQAKDLGNPAAAQAALDKLVAEKQRKGYAAKGGGGGKPAAKAVAKTAAKAPAKATSKVGAKSPAPAAASDWTGALTAVLDEKKIKPASDKSFAAIEALLGEVPAPLRALYGVASNLDTLIGEPEESLAWLSIDGGVSATKTNRKYGVPDTYFAVATNHGGDYACFDRTTGRVFYWDHEEREASPLAKSLEAYVTKDLVPILRRDLKEKAALAKEREAATSEKGGGARSGGAGGIPEAPKKLVPVPSTLLNKFDRPGYGGGADSAAFLDDERIVMGFQNSGAILSLRTQKDIFASQAGGNVVFDASSNRIVSANYGVLSIVDAKSGEPVTRFKTDVGHGATVVLAPGSGIACLHAYDGSLQLWDLASKGLPKHTSPRTSDHDLPKGKPLAKLAGHAKGLESARFSPDGSLLVSGDQEGKLCLWDVAKRSLVRSVATKHRIQSVDFGADGKSIFVAHEPRDVAVYDLELAPLRTWKTVSAVRDLRVLSASVVAILGLKELALVEPLKGKVYCKLAQPQKGRPPKIADVRGDLLLTCGPAKLTRVV